MASFKSHPIVNLALIAVLLAGFGTTTRAIEFAGGTGAPDDPYQIATAEQLVAIGSDPNLLSRYFILINDIDLDPNLAGGRVFDRAVVAPDNNAVEYFQGIPFTGCLDGAGHAIRNLVIHDAAADYVGLFGSVDSEGLIRNLHLEDVSILANDNAGGLAGYSIGTIRSCSIEGKVAGRWYVGGLVGRNGGSVIDCHATIEFIANLSYGICGGLAGGNAGLIADCHVTGTMEAHGDIGGLVGENGGPIINCRAAVDLLSDQKHYHHGGLVGCNMGALNSCYTTGRVSGGGQAGGLVGANWGSGTIANCHATASVSGGVVTDVLGGLVGSNQGGITNCYATGRLAGGKAKARVGGLVGESLMGTVYHSFWDVQTCGVSESAGGIGLSTSHMQNPQTFVAAGWDFTQETGNGTAEPWSMPQDGGYPQLTVFSESYQRHPLEGAGTGSEPYRIADANDLGAICHYGLEACYTMTSIVTGQDANNLGGLVGANAWSTIENCYSRGLVVGGKSSCAVGGLVGRNSEGGITDCYTITSTATESDSARPDKLVGYGRNGVVTSSYFVSSSSGGNPDEEGSPISGEQMKRQASFARWDFESVWMICEGQNYPRLRWEGVECGAAQGL